MKRQLLALLALSVATCLVLGQDDQDCSPDNTDPGELAEMNIFQTVLLEKQGITEEIIEEQMRQTADPSIQEIAKSERDFQASVEAGRASIDVEPEQPTTATSKWATQELAWFRPVCPYRYYWLNNYKWFFYNNGNAKYCWSYYPIYVTSCTTRYCNWWFTNPYTVYFYYRCFPEYRMIFVWARCATYNSASGWTWSSEYVRRAVPRGCCCRRYLNPILTARQCPAAATPVSTQ